MVKKRRSSVFGSCNVPDRCLSFTGRFCGGLILDIKRKAPFFISDFTDGFHIQALSATLFIYLGTVTNAITFGGLLGDATENMQVRRGLTLSDPPRPGLDLSEEPAGSFPCRGCWRVFWARPSQAEFSVCWRASR